LARVTTAGRTAHQTARRSTSSVITAVARGTRRIVAQRGTSSAVGELSRFGNTVFGDVGKVVFNVSNFVSFGNLLEFRVVIVVSNLINIIIQNQDLNWVKKKLNFE